jgi:hypothetical protein
MSSAGSRVRQSVQSLAVPDDERLSYNKATPYVTDLQAADPDNDGYVDKTEFMDACQKRART